jgi:hypothetical protein
VLAGEGHDSGKKDGLIDEYVQTGKTFRLEVFDDRGAALMELSSVVRDVELGRDYGKFRVDIRFNTRFCVFRRHKFTRACKES